jgi:hypothetical protein
LGEQECLHSTGPKGGEDVVFASEDMTAEIS